MGIEGHRKYGLSQRIWTPQSKFFVTGPTSLSLSACQTNCRLHANKLISSLPTAHTAYAHTPHTMHTPLTHQLFSTSPSVSSTGLSFGESLECVCLSI